MNTPIRIIEITPLLGGGSIVTWVEENSAMSIQHNTFTLCPQEWIDGYKEGKTLMELAEMSKKKA